MELTTGIACQAKAIERIQGAPLGLQVAEQLQVRRRLRPGRAVF